MVRGRHVAGLAELALPLLAAAREQVPLEHALELELAGRGALEAILGAGVSLDLGHGSFRGTRLCLMPDGPPRDKSFRHFPAAARRARSPRGSGYFSS